MAQEEDHEWADNIIIFRRISKEGVEVYLKYNFVDEPFIFFEWKYRKANELYECSLISIARKFNFPDFYYEDKEFKITVEYDPFGIHMWLETVTGKELFAKECLAETRNRRPVIGEKLRKLLEKLQKHEALNSFIRALKLTILTSKEIIKTILDIMRNPELRKEIYSKIHQKDMEVCEETEPECFYKIEEFMRDIKALGRHIIESNNIIRQILKITKEHLQEKP